MGLSSLLAIALTTTAFVNGQYGPIKGPTARRTTTPFPPGFQSDNDLYNAEPNSISPLPNQVSGSYSYKDNSASLSGSFSSTSSNAPDNAWWSNNPAPLNNAPSGYGSAPTSSQKTPAGAFAQPDNPWLSGIIAQNSQPKPAAKRPGSCGYGGCGSSIPEQQTRPTVPCTTPGYVCVQKFQCQNGQTYSTGTGATQCDLNTEVCCQRTEPRPLPAQPQPTYQPRPQPLPTYQPPRPQPQPTYQPPPPPPPPQPKPQPSYPQPTYQPPPPPQPKPQPSYPQPTYQPPPPKPKPQPGYPQPQTYQQPQFQQPQPSYSQPTYSPPPPTPKPAASYPQPSYTPGNNGIPIGGSIYDSSANRPVAQRPSNYVTPPPFQPYTGPLNTTPHPGCAAALKCVEEIYCTQDGVMSDSPVYLTREQAENKVPLSDCQNIETGIIGKCCRDPNYKDPWPAGMMMNGPSHFDDGQYHEPTHQHQGTPNVNCGPSATCTPQYQCPGERQTQPGKACQVPQDGSTGVCCNRPQFPPGSNNQQFNTAPSNVYPTTTALTTPAQQYYTPRPSLANNPFLSGKLPTPQKRPAPGYPAPTPYTAQPNAITEQKRYPEYGKSSTPVPVPDIDVRSRPSRPSRPVPGYPQPVAQASTLAPEVTNLTPQASNLPSQEYLPQSYSRPLPDSNKRTDEPVGSSTITVITLGTDESNDITPAPTPKQEEITPLTSPESEAPIIIPSSKPRVRGPAPGYPFLAPTTEAPSIVRSTAAPLPLSTPEPGKECGVRRGVPRPNGPAGLETGFGEFPWQAQIVSSADQSPLCGGAILSEKVVVTAAHCINNLQSKDIMVKAGDWKLGTENPAEEPKPVQIRFVAAIAKHPKYDPVSQFNDMAVLVLEQPLKLDSHVDTLCLGEDLPPGQKPRGSNCVVTGWGKANLQGNVPGSTMHSIPVNFIENEQCEKAFQNTYLGKYFQLHKSFTCALPVTPNHDLCQVDVGSPIACQKPDGRYELSGIYSWDVGCHPNTNIPAAASSVDKKWVQEVMQKPVEQVKREEREEIAKKENLGQIPLQGSETKPGFSQGYGK